jgi:hypothetical protein
MKPYVAASYDTQFLSFDATSIQIHISHIFHLGIGLAQSLPVSGIGTGKYLVIEGLWVQFILSTEQIWVRSDSSLGHQGFEVTHFYDLLLLRLGVHAASNSAYSGYPELWILRFPAHRYHAVPLPGFEPTTLWLRVRRPNHSATTLQVMTY